MDMRNIRTFLRVVDLESFTKAAEELNYAQSTVTTQILQMERELGFSLFDRLGKKIYLSSLGREFLTYANDISHIMLQVGILGKSENEMTGTLRVGVLESLLFHTMLDVIQEYNERYPNIYVEIKMGQVSELMELLKQNQLDMIYISGNLIEDSRLHCCYLHCCYKREERIIFVTSPWHALAVKKLAPLADVLSYPLIVTERSGTCYSKLSELATAHDLELRHFLMIDNTKAIAELLRKGVGVSFLPEYSVRRHIENGELAGVDADIEPQIYHSQILYHKSKWIAPYTEGLIAIIRKMYPEEAA
ncbi:MAG: LysR family transcriptional regulator [Synergistaceae bacterium]|jgi:DNA-binding transcriptional LysR family regulator|nr:LysR family transcriptional regulator [Synergistaceae bacterium]